MSLKYKTYPEYIHSSSQYVGEMPKHWLVSRLKYYAYQIVDGAHFTPTYVDEGVPFLRVTDIQSTIIDKSRLKFIPQVEHDELIKRCKPVCGDLLLSKNGTIGIPKIVDWDWEFSIFVSLCLIKLKRSLDASFLSYFFESHEIKEQIYGQIKQSTVINLHLDKIENFEIALPVLDEQQKIVNFLDHETAKIDTLIEKQQQLIKLLKEKRQAVISHAVTKGLNPDAPMRDSGVEWLGEVPEGWKVLRINQLFSENSSRASSDIELAYPVLTVSIHNGISDKELNDEELDRKAQRSEDRSLYKVVQSNFLAYNMMRAWQGGFGASKVGGLVSPAYVVCQPKTILNSSYFELVLRTPNAVVELKRFSRGITDFRLRLYWDEFKNINVPVPPEAEINSILKSISNTNSVYDRLESVAKKQIRLLQERRTALISAAVTGKIDVRNWEPPINGSEEAIA